ncbi:MAG: histone deacetylase family protein [Chloroflexi bacterium]|nr:histone deacetylase family protein [Chloroflexota bacterium]
MKVVHSEAHRAHTYAHEVTGGLPTRAWETVARAEAIRAALEAVGHDLRAPADHDAAAITAVHDPAMLRYLETAWSDWRANGLDRATIVPDTLPLAGYRAGMGAATEPASPCGRIGYWCFDTMTPIVEGTYPAARGAVDVALSTASLVMDGASAAYGLCRPPGHHAARAMFGGYCYFNNAAIAAQWLVERSGARIGVLDVDIHHGNGTQQIFYDRPDVAYASLHADPMRMYPYFSGHADERGAGAGLDATFNQPLPAGADDTTYLRALERALDWLLDRTDGPLVVSLGLDTYRDDPIGDFALTTPLYRVCGARTAGTRRPLVILQEGGYDVATLGENVREWLAGVEEVGSVEE